MTPFPLTNPRVGGHVARSVRQIMSPKNILLILCDRCVFDHKSVFIPLLPTLFLVTALSPFHQRKKKVKIYLKKSPIALKNYDDGGQVI